ncbi:hypothetical protein WJU23_20830 [Prosthecobacter sp. SYSU 5D2]|uniref:hypothetical protein n=1 Tax=Prosthecobacter sp. SYSU 5D2 TaxID=3134134 RepID=UPI0031FE8C8C
MKRHTLLATLLLPGPLLLAEEPPAAPRLVPRPIPGMPAIPAIQPPALKAAPVIPGGQADGDKAVLPKDDQARVIYIHRRATLPTELTQNLPVAKKTKTSAPQIQVIQPAVKIIPKSQAQALVSAKK